MNINRTWIAISIFSAASFMSKALAEPFQLQASALIAQFDTKIQNGGGVEGDVLGFSALYYLLPVDTNRGPLAQRPFLDKSAFIYGTFTQTKPELGTDSDSISLGARFVTQQDMIFEIDYNKTDSGNSGNSDTVKLGVGKYLDRDTTAVLYYEVDDENNSDINTFGAFYSRFLDNSAANGTSTAFRLGLAYLDTDNDSGFEIDVGGTYYLSEYLSVGATLEFLDVGDFDETTIRLSGKNFFTETVFAELEYITSSNSRDFDADFIGIRAGMRF